MRTWGGRWPRLLSVPFGSLYLECRKRGFWQELESPRQGLSFSPFFGHNRAHLLGSCGVAFGRCYCHYGLSKKKFPSQPVDVIFKCHLFLQIWTSLGKQRDSKLMQEVMERIRCIRISSRQDSSHTWAYFVGLGARFGGLDLWVVIVVSLFGSVPVDLYCSIFSTFVWCYGLILLDAALVGFINLKPNASCILF